jgi:OPA family glycerol-3-phosphate transporter-like MFS transporter
MPEALAPLSPTFRQRRVQNWLIVGLLYSFFYMSRYNFSALAPQLMDVFGWTKVDLALLETAMPFLYGISVLVNAAIADRIGGKRAFLIGAVGVVIMNTVFGLFHLTVLTPPVITGEGVARVVTTPAVLAWGLSARQMAYVMSGVWALNAYFQSFGALSIVKINAHWFHISERGTFGAIFGVLIRLGLIFAFSGVPFIASILPWQWAFWVPAICVGLLGTLTWLFVVDSPDQAGLPVFDTGEGDDGGPKVRVRDVAKKIFTSRVMWMIAIASVMIGFVRRSVVDAWWPVYFDEVHDVARTNLIYQCSAWGIAICGILGGFVLGPLSDRVFDARRAPVVVIGFVGMALCLGLFWTADALGLGGWGAFMAISMLSFFVNGTHGLIGGAASMDFGGKKGAATAAGLFDGMQYFFAAPFTGMLVGYITENYGWQVWKLWPLPFAVVGAVVMSRLWNVKPGRRAH